MKLLCAGKLQPEYCIPDWAIARRGRLETAEPDVQMVASIGMSLPPEFWASRYIGGKREIVTWGNGWSSQMVVEA